MPQPAELIWARYTKENKQQTYLLLFLGEQNNIIFALIADKVPDGEVTALRINLPQIQVMGIKEIAEWVKKNMPISYTNAFKNFSSDKLTILRSYGLKTIETKPT